MDVGIQDIHGVGLADDGRHRVSDSSDDPINHRQVRVAPVIECSEDVVVDRRMCVILSGDGTIPKVPEEVAQAAQRIRVDPELAVRRAVGATERLITILIWTEPDKGYRH